MAIDFVAIVIKDYNFYNPTITKRMFILPLIFLGTIAFVQFQALWVAMDKTLRLFGGLNHCFRYSWFGGGITLPMCWSGSTP